MVWGLWVVFAPKVKTESAVAKNWATSKGKTGQNLIGGLKNWGVLTDAHTLKQQLLLGTFMYALCAPRNI